MNKALLINAPLYNTDDQRSFLPLGIAYITSYIRDKGIVCDMVDANCTYPAMSIEEIISKCVGYDIIGISTNTLNFKNAIFLAQQLKSCSHSPLIVFGGHHSTFEHERIIKNYECIDAVIRGEGEHAWYALCQDYFTNRKITCPFPGLTFRTSEGELVISDHIIIIDDLDALPYPLRELQRLYYKKPFKGKKVWDISVSTSRGCPYNCSFCSVTNFRRRWSGRSPHNVAKEIIEIYNEFEDIFLVFCDDNFYIDPERSIQIIDLVYQQLGVRFMFSFATRTDQIINGGQVNLQHFKEKGCYSIELGIENGCETMLKRLNKNTSPQQNAIAIDMVRQTGIYTAIDYIMFDPQTTIDELKQNFNFIQKNKIVGHYPVVLDNRIKPYPGTAYQYIDMDHYFVDPDVAMIYEVMHMFRDKYGHTIEHVIDSHETIYDKTKIRTNVRNYAWCKVLPYDIFNYLITNYHQLENTDEALHAIEKKFRIVNQLESCEY